MSSLKTTQQILNLLLLNGIKFVPGPGLQLGRTAVADAAYQLLANSNYIGYTALTAARTATLPAVAGLNVGQVMVVADESGSAGAFAITVAGSGAETIEGAANIVINEAYGYVILVSTGTGWEIVGSKGLPDLTKIADLAYTVKASDTNVIYTALTAGRAVTLPAVATVRPGKIILIADGAGTAAASNLTVHGNAAENLDGANTKVINTNYGFIRVMACGTFWKLV